MNPSHLSFATGLTAVALFAQGSLDAADPVLVGQWPGYARGYAKAVAVAGNYAYVATDEAAGLHVIDISTPAKPRRVGGCDTTTGSGQLAVSGHYAYAVCGSLLLVIDISNPSNPTRVGQCTLAGPGGVALSGNYAYVSE
jgi:hypothetical protein